MDFKERQARFAGEQLPLRSCGGKPGVRVPPGEKEKTGRETKLPEAAGSKTIKSQQLADGEPSNIGPAPAHRRIYMRDYSKVRPSPGDTDLVTQELGNPLRW